MGNLARKLGVARYFTINYICSCDSLYCKNKSPSEKKPKAIWVESTVKFGEVKDVKIE